MLCCWSPEKPAYPARAPAWGCLLRVLGWFNSPRTSSGAHFAALKLL
uniref:Basic, immunoglobulin-like variable motif containing n=1 Tax=Homo sapiens TaxID=9606 RepID=A0A494C0F9_HUMAN